MSDDPRYVPRLDLVLYDEDESEPLRQSHYTWSLQSPCYDSDHNMVRDSVRCIKRVDSDGETVATDDTRVLQTYNSDWSVDSGDMRDTLGTDEAPAVSPRPSNRCHSRSSLRRFGLLGPQGEDSVWSLWRIFYPSSIYERYFTLEQGIFISPLSDLRVELPRSLFMVDG